MKTKTFIAVVLIMSGGYLFCLANKEAGIQYGKAFLAGALIFAGYSLISPD